MIKKELYGATVKEQLTASVLDKMHHFLLADGTIRGALLHATRMVNEMRANHGLGILETLVLGHAYMASGLMTTNLKGNDRLSLQIDCSGPIKGLVVEANAFGEVRGYLKQVPIPVEKPLEDFNLSPFFGAGFLKVTKYLEDAKQPFSGQIMLTHGSIAKDLTLYYSQSEQIPTAFNLSVLFDPDGAVIGAGGLFLQVLPGAEEQTAAGLESLVKQMPSIGVVFSQSLKAEDIIRSNFSDFGPRMIGSRQVEFMCHCNPERIRSMLLLLPVDELADIKENGPFPLAITCHYCNTVYEFDQNELRILYDQRFPNN